MSTVTERCSLCFEKSKNRGDDLIWLDSLQLCQKCYDKYTKSAYNQRTMLINSLKCYRKLVERYEDTSSTKIDTSFSGIS